MKTERAYETQIFNFPSGILNVIKDKSDWQLICITDNPEHNQLYNLCYKGKKVIQIGRLYGFGWGSCAVYPILRWSVIKLLRTLCEVNIWGSKIYESCIYENDYE